jgi:archaellin
MNPNRGGATLLLFLLLISAGRSSRAGETGRISGTMNDNATNVVIISYVDADQKVDNLYWTKTFIGQNNRDDMLDPGEQVQITIGGAATHATSGGNLTDALSPHLTVNKSFTIEIKTASGSVLTFERTIPATVNSVMSLN